MNRQGISQGELKEFQSILHQRIKMLKGDLSGLEHNSEAGDQSSVPDHMAELASDASEKAFSYGRMESQTEELKEIQDALERIKDGTFGSCENCQARIPKGRLKAITYARLCVKCQEKAERE